MDAPGPSEEPPNPLLLSDARAAAYRLLEVSERMIRANPGYRVDIDEAIENICKPLRSAQSLKRVTEEVYNAVWYFAQLSASQELFHDSYTPEIDDLLDRICGCFGMRRETIEEEALRACWCCECREYNLSTEDNVCGGCAAMGYRF